MLWSYCQRIHIAASCRREKWRVAKGSKIDIDFELETIELFTKSISNEWWFVLCEWAIEKTSIVDSVLPPTYRNALSLMAARKPTRPHYLLRRHKYKFLTKAESRSPSAQEHIERISKMNHKIAQMEIIKEHFHQLFECPTYLEAKPMFDDCVRWAFESKARCLLQWLKSIGRDVRF